jgi:hypothetical protein
VERTVGCHGRQIERRDLRAGLERFGDTVAQRLRLGALGIADGKDILVDEALLGQGAEQAERPVGRSLRSVCGHVLKHRPAQRGEKPL